MQLKGLGKPKIFQWPHWDWNSRLPTCSIAPQPTTLPRANYTRVYSSDMNILLKSVRELYVNSKVEPTSLVKNGKLREYCDEIRGGSPSSIAQGWGLWSQFLILVDTGNLSGQKSDLTRCCSGLHRGMRGFIQGPCHLQHLPVFRNLDQSCQTFERKFQIQTKVMKWNNQGS
jgi:hypothetical protein